MKRSSRRTANLQSEQPAASAAAPAAAESAEATQGTGLTLGWRVALFIWASGFACLLAYELLN
ncbi:MAG TPA: hypothetical protein VMS17_09200, partial [Gemmataceae bacterium]|nr:hypothetical protein [Gemmataceae bacterium]